MENENILLRISLLFGEQIWPENVGMVKTKLNTKVTVLPNQNNAINGMRKTIDDQTTCLEKIMLEFCNFPKTFPRSTAECEGSFSLMNIICTDVRSKLTINNISNSNVHQY